MPEKGKWIETSYGDWRAFLFSLTLSFRFFCPVILTCPCKMQKRTISSQTQCGVLDLRGLRSVHSFSGHHKKKDGLFSLVIFQLGGHFHSKSVNFFFLSNFRFNMHNSSTGIRRPSSIPHTEQNWVPYLLALLTIPHCMPHYNLPTKHSLAPNNRPKYEKQA